MFLIFVGQRIYDSNIFTYLPWIVVCCLLGWIILYNYWFFKKIDTHETPDQLLCLVEKKKRINKISGYAAWIILIVCSIICVDYGMAWGLTLCALIFILTNNRGNDIDNQSTNEIIKQLQELVDQD